MTMPARNNPYPPQPAPLYQQQTQFWPQPPAPARRGRRVLAVLLVLALFVLVVVAGLVGGGLAFVYGRGRVLPGVSALGVPLGGQTPEQAAATLADRWQSQTVTLTDGDRTWELLPGALGMTLDTAATAQAAAGNALAAGQTVTDSFSYTASDGSLTDSARSPSPSPRPAR